MDQETQKSVSDFLEHFGVKGMKWGVVNEDETAITENKVKKLRQEKHKRGPDGAIKDFMKEDSSESDSKGSWRPTKKQVAVVAAGAVAAGFLVYKIKTKDAPNFAPHSVDDYLSIVGERLSISGNTTTPPPNLKNLIGKKVSKKQYKELVRGSWDRHYMSEISQYNFDIPGETIPAGHEFFRLSGAAEKSFSKRTYMIGSKEDLNRYVSSFIPDSVDDGAVPHLISFKSKSPVVTADLKDRLDALHTVMSRDFKKNATPRQVLDEYEIMSMSRFETKRGPSFMNELRARGFSAFVDDNNAGIIGEKPLVLIDSSKVTPKQATRLTQDMMDEALENLTEMANRK